MSWFAPMTEEQERLHRLQLTGGLLPLSKARVSENQNPTESGWLSDPGREEWLARKAAKSASVRAAPPSPSAPPSTPSPTPAAVAAQIIAAGEKARTPQNDDGRFAPPPGSVAAQILAAAAKRDNNR